MKLLYVTNSRFPSERAHMLQVVKMCNAFASAGVETALAVTNRPTQITDPAESYYGEKFQFSVKRVPVIDLATWAGRLPRVIGRLLYTVQRLSYVWRLSAVQQYDIVYGRDPVILYLLGRRYGFVNIVYESHEAHFNFFVRRLVHHGVKIVVISEGIYEAYREKGVPKEQMQVAHDAIDESFLNGSVSQKEARERLGLRSDKPVAMYIGGFDTWKGVETFFAASKYTDAVQFVAIGGSEDEVQLYREKYPQVHFLGARPYNQLALNQRAADVLVVPNTAKNELSAKYTSPLKLFAHMASGVPLVVSDIPSLRAVVEEDSAYFFTADDPAALAKVLETVVKDPVTAAHKAEQAMEVVSEYTWEKRVAFIQSFISPIA